MVKHYKQKSNSIRRSMPLSTWEASVLLLMLCLIIVIQYASPFFTTPQAQFIRSYSSGSASFNLTAIHSGISGNFSSSSYSLRLVAGDSSGISGNQNYILYLGSAQLIYSGIAIIGAPQFFEQTAIPANPSYTSFQIYQFSVKILGQDNITDVNFTFFKSGIKHSSFKLGNGVVKQQNDIYTVSYSELVPSNYSYQWSAVDAFGRSNIDSIRQYIISKASPNLNLALGNSQNNITISKGALVVTKATSTNPSLDIILITNGGDVISNKSSVERTFDSSLFNPGTYIITASVTGNENVSSQFIAKNITIVSINFSSITTSSPSGQYFTPGQIYRFYADFSGNISDIIFEFNLVNYSFARGELNKTIIDGKIVYFKEFRNLSAGNYTYKWYAIDVIGSTTVLGPFIFEIKKTPSLIKVIQGEANKDAGERSKIYPQNTVANVTASINVTGKSVNLKIIDPLGSQISDSAVDKSQLFKPLSILGLYSIIASFDGDQNTDNIRVNKWMVSYDPNNIEKNPPSFSFQSENATKMFEGEKILLWINVSDPSLVDYVRLLTNYTGNYLDNQSVFVNEPSRNVTFEFLVPDQAGKVIGWRVVANDSFNNMFTSNTLSFSVFDWADVNYDRTISVGELGNVITRYFKGEGSGERLLRSVQLWLNGGSY